MADVQKYSLKEGLVAANEEHMWDLALLGMSGLTQPSYINSMRSTMFTSHLNQLRNFLRPELPLVHTNMENLVGKHSNSYKKLDDPHDVFRKVYKYDDIMDTPNIYQMFVYNRKTKRYDVMKRKVCEDLTENFGYDINNSVIDSLEEGDKIKKGTVLYKSTSYDEYNNYGYGKNTPVIYTLDPFTYEDAAVCSKSYAKACESIETEEFAFGLNHNDYLLNIHGSKKKYRGLPDIGEVCEGYLAVVRRQFNDQLAYDFKESSTREIHEGDQPIYLNGYPSEIIDYDIYINNNEIEENTFNKQIMKYIKSQNKYFQEIKETCEEIFDICSKDSKRSYSRDVDYLYKRALERLDTDKKWKEGDAIYISVTVRQVVPLSKGIKITGRYGNKSVVADVVDDDKMPFYYDSNGVKHIIHLKLNLFAIINRTTSMVLYEIFINHCTRQICEEMRRLKTLEAKKNMFMKTIKIFNEQQYLEEMETYDRISDDDKELYIQDIIDNGIMIRIDPLWEKKPIFDCCLELRDAFDFIQPDDVYINKWGREIKTLSKQWIGDMYMIKLKQSDRRGFSSRSTGAVDTKGLPVRSHRSRSHLEPYSGTAIRFGEFETLNFSIGVLPDDIALFHAMYRTSPKGRKQLIETMFDDDQETSPIQKIDGHYTSRVAELFNVLFKSLSCSISFEDDEDTIRYYDTDGITPHEYDGETYMCTDYEYFLIERAYEIKKEILEICPVIESDVLYDRIVKVMKERDYIMGPVENAMAALPESFTVV